MSTEAGITRKAGLTRGQLIFVPAVHPRFDAVFRQLPFAGFFLLSLVIFVVQVPSITEIPAFWLSIWAGFIATVLSLFSKNLVHEGDTWISIVPVLDYVALSLMCVVDPEIYLTPMILLSVIPALWLGSIEKTYGFVIVVIMSFLSMFPSVLFHYALHKNLELSEVLALFLIPTFSSVAAGTIHSMTLRSSMKERALLYQEARLERTILHERESSRLRDSIVQAVGRGLLVVNAQGEEILVNKLMRIHPILETNQLTASQLETHGWFFSADKITPVEAGEGPVARALRGDNFTGAMYWVGDPERTERYALAITARALKDPDGSIAGSVLAIQDVTNFMDALEAKDTFISTVSHELRTPLTSITGYLELIRDEADRLPADVVKYLDVAERNTHRLLTLVTDLLTVARAERGEMPLTKSSCDLGQIVVESVHAFEKAAELKDITLKRDGLDHAPLIADPERLAQLVENLVSNSVKYTPNGGHVSVTLRETTPIAGYEIVVQDDGLGIPLDEQSQLFTKFYRALSVRNGSIPGMGLGLAICQKIAEAHGGRLALSSEPGRGTTVTAFVPSGL